MNTSIRTYFKQLVKTTESRALLQQSYAAAAVALFVIAGLVSLIQPTAGQTLLWLAFASCVIYFANAIVWALIQSAIATYLTDKRKR